MIGNYVSWYMLNYTVTSPLAIKDLKYAVYCSISWKIHEFKDLEADRFIQILWPLYFASGNAFPLNPLKKDKLLRNITGINVALKWSTSSLGKTGQTKCILSQGYSDIAAVCLPLFVLELWVSPKNQNHLSTKKLLEKKKKGKKTRRDLRSYDPERMRK